MSSTTRREWSSSHTTGGSWSTVGEFNAKLQESVCCDGETEPPDGADDVASHARSHGDRSVEQQQHLF